MKGGVSAGAEQDDVGALVQCWSLFASHTFYALAAQPTFTTIPWEAAFVGVPGNFPVQAVPATLVVVRLFAGNILVTMALPLLVIAGATGRVRWRVYFDVEWMNILCRVAQNMIWHGVVV
jgi:hypothetical protein